VKRYRALLIVACVAAVAASCGDLLMLYVGNSQRPELGLAPAPTVVLWIGAVLGVIGLPLYGTGYWAIARTFAQRRVRGAWLIAASGVGGAIVGAVIHGMTALEIDSALASASAARPPLEAVAGGDRALLYLWLTCGALLLVASLGFAACQVRAATGSARWLAVANPVVLTVLLVGLSMPSELSRSFVAPAAPNLAHVLFFLMLARIADVE
jgi:hypothetical protein